MHAYQVRRYGPALVLGPGVLITVLLSLLVGCSPKKASPPDSEPGGGELLTIPADAPTNASACDERLGFARQAMDDLVTAASGSCSADAECATVFAETGCFGACEAAILSSRLAEFREAQAAIDQRVCTTYVADGCSFSGPRCMDLEAVCEQGRCAVKQAHG